jgi:SAM-dependent methyltransferase
LSSGRRRFESLERDAPREVWFAALHDAIEAHYLAEPGNPYRQSGRSSGASRWEETRRCVAEAVDRDGDFMDVGCANGLLLETLAGWCAEKGVKIRPHGVDFVAALVALARERHPRHAGSFEVANAFTWEPRRQYDFVRASLECVQERDRPELLRRLFDRAVATGGRLIVCHYPDRGESLVDVGSYVERLGYAVAGRSSASNVSLAWTDKS